MPLYDFLCDSCGSVHEELVASADDTTAVHCPACGAPCRRQTVSRFQISGTRPRTDPASLAASGGDLVTDTDTFVTAMDTFGDSIGDGLTASQKERAVERLKKARP